MVRESKQVGVQLSCETLGVSTSGYYAWLERPESERKQRNNELMRQIVKISDASQSTYGRPRIQRTLLGMSIRCGKTRLENMMKLAGVSGQIKKRFRVKTTDSNHTNPISERVFKTEQWHTHPTQANQVWASDITYVHTTEGFVFLAIFLDLFTKKVVGFSTDDHMRSELIINALEMAIGRQKIKDIPMVAHSDRGSQYAGLEYRKKLKELKITSSMSRRGNCYDNAFAESFFATIKKELIYRTKFATKTEAKKAIFEYIEVWYNRQRIHSSIGYMTPIQFEESLRIA